VESGLADPTLAAVVVAQRRQAAATLVELFPAVVGASIEDTGAGAQGR